MTTTKKSKAKTRILKDLYELYPHKKRHPPNVTRPPTKHWTYDPEHELALNIVQWRTLTKIYLTLLGKFLLSGQPVLLPNKMGIFKMFKYKYPETKQRPDFGHYHKTGEWRPYKNNHTNGYGPIVEWNRGRYQADLRRKYYWMIRLNRNFKKYLSKKIIENPSMLFAYDDVSRNK